MGVGRWDLPANGELEQDTLNELCLTPGRRIRGLKDATMHRRATSSFTQELCGGDFKLNWEQSASSDDTASTLRSSTTTRLSRKTSTFRVKGLRVIFWRLRVCFPGLGKEFAFGDRK